MLQNTVPARATTAQDRTLLLGYRAVFITSPGASNQSDAQTLVEEGCEGFSRVHNAMTVAQRFKAVQSVKGYEQDFLVLAAQ